MGKETNTIRIAPDQIEETMSELNNLLSRLGVLDVDKNKLLGDSGAVEEERKEYDRTLTMVMEQLKELITVTIRFMQKVNSTFVETDQNIAGKI